MVVEDMPVGLRVPELPPHGGHVRAHHAHEHPRAIVFTFKGGRIAKMRWLQWAAAAVAYLVPFIAIQTGWITAEVGRQPWVVYPSVTGPDGVALLTADAISMSVSRAGAAG